MRYRKKPVVIEAKRFDGSVSSMWDIHAWMEASGSTLIAHCGSDRVLFLIIGTLEGDMKAGPGDYIIKGVQGEFYPCRSAIFEATYEPVGEGS